MFSSWQLRITGRLNIDTIIQIAESVLVACIDEIIDTMCNQCRSVNLK